MQSAQTKPYLDSSAEVPSFSLLALDSCAGNQTAWFNPQLSHLPSGSSSLNYSILQFPYW